MGTADDRFRADVVNELRILNKNLRILSKINALNGLVQAGVMSAATYMEEVQNMISML